MNAAVGANNYVRRGPDYGKANIATIRLWVDDSGRSERVDLGRWCANAWFSFGIGRRDVPNWERQANLID